MLLLVEDYFPSHVLEDNASLWPLEILEEEHDKVGRLLVARARSTAGPLFELIELEKRMIEYHRRVVDLLTSRLSRHDRLAPSSIMAAGLLPQPRNR